MADLTQQILQQFDTQHVAAIANQLGVQPEQAESAIQQAIPLVIGGLARQSETADGEQAIHAAMNQHGALDMGSILGSMLGGGARGGGGMGGGLGGALTGSILESIFGARQDRATQNLGRSTGLGSQGASRLLMMLAPVVLGMIMRRMGGGAQTAPANRPMNQAPSTGGLGGGLGDLLGREVQNMGQRGQGGFLSGMLDQDGDGDVDFGDLLKMGAGMLGNRRV